MMLWPPVFSCMIPTAFLHQIFIEIRYTKRKSVITQLAVVIRLDLSWGMIKNPGFYVSAATKPGFFPENTKRNRILSAKSSFSPNSNLL